MGQSISKRWNGQHDESKSGSHLNKETCTAPVTECNFSQRHSGNSDSICQSSACEETSLSTGGDHLDFSAAKETKISQRFVCQAFRTHYSDLATGILHPDKLASILYAKSLISRGTKEAVQTTLGISTAQKAAILLSAVESTLITSTQPHAILKGFCQAAKKERALKPVLRRMKETVGALLSESESESEEEEDAEDSPVSIQDDGTRQVMTCSPVEQYKHFLKKLYSRGIHRNEHKWPPVLVKDFINLLWVNKKGVSCQCARDMRKDTVLGRMDRIDGTKTDMDFCDIANTEIGQHPQCIIVQGAPGSGKTTFAYEVCKRWGQGKILQQYSMVVLLPLRDKTIQNANTLEDLLRHDSMEIQKKVNRVVKEKAGEGVLLLLEGFDELPEEKRSESSLFMKLICGKILPLATVMVTSRPWATSSLLKHYSHRISQHIEIMGFSKENIKEYISQAFPDAEEQEKFQKYLDLYPHMQLSMNIPINCAIVVEVYRSSDSINTTPKTMTQLYKALVMTLLLRFLLSHPDHRDTDWMLERFEDLPEPVYQQLKQISELAYSGMMNLQLIFLNLPSHFETLGLLHKVAELYPHRGQSISYSFMHLTLQEFLAAYHISLMDSKEQERHFLELGYIAKDIRSYLPSRFFGNVLQFLSGLGGLKNADVILTDELEVDTLYKHLFKHNNSLMVSDVLTGGAYDMHVSTLCQWLFEAQDESLIAKVYGTLHRVEKVRHNLAHNMYALGYCIATSQCSWELNTTFPPYILAAPSDSYATDQHLEMLCKGLSASEGGRGHFTVINLQSNRFTSEGILLLLQIPHHLLERLTELDLSRNRLDARMCSGLAQMLSSHSLPYIRRVSLEHNPIPSGGCLHLIRALTTTPSLSEVVLPHLSADECRVLMSVDQITVLVLDAPKKDALSVVAFAMQHNTTLKELGLRSSKFAQLTISTLCTALSSNSTLHILDLQSSTIPDNGGEYLGAMLTVNATLEKLNLLYVSTSKRGITKLVQSLEHNSTLRELWIFEDYEDCVQPLMKKPYIKNRLHIDYCP